MNAALTNEQVLKVMEVAKSEYWSAKESGRPIRMAAALERAVVRANIPFPLRGEARSRAGKILSDHADVARSTRA